MLAQHVVVIELPAAVADEERCRLQGRGGGAYLGDFGDRVREGGFVD